MCSFLIHILRRIVRRYRPASITQVNLYRYNSQLSELNRHAIDELHPIFIPSVQVLAICGHTPILHLSHSIPNVFKLFIDMPWLSLTPYLLLFSHQWQWPVVHQGTRSSRRKMMSTTSFPSASFALMWQTLSCVGWHSEMLVKEVPEEKRSWNRKPFLPLLYEADPKPRH